MKAKIVKFIFVTIALTFILTLLLLVADLIVDMFPDKLNVTVSNIHKWTHIENLFSQLKFSFILALVFALIHLFFSNEKQG